MALLISNLDESPHSRWQTWTEKHWLRCSAAGTLGWWWALGDSGHIDWPGNAEAFYLCFLKMFIYETSGGGDSTRFFFSWAYLGIPKRKVVGAFFYFYQADWDRPHPETKHMRVSRQLILVCIGCWHFILKIIGHFFINEMGKKWDNSPHGEDLEEFYHQGRSGSIWVHLTNPGYHYGPRYTAQEAQLVGVNVTLWRETTENIRLQHLYYYLKAPFRYLIRLL